MKKKRFIKLRLIWAIIRGRTVVYKAEIDMAQNILNFTTTKGSIVNCRFIYPPEKVT